MNKKIFIIFLLVDLILLAGPELAGMSAYPGGAVEREDVLYPPGPVLKPKIDGNLDDETWKTPPLKKDFITYEPIYGEKLPYETLVWMTYDSKNLYFAFKCYDSESQKIKTSLTKRDNMWSDDWVGITLDSLGNKQTTYGFCVNPSGIQGDLLESTSNPPDLSPDFVWESAGKVTPGGYQVEICIPLKSIRFESGKEVEMGIMFRRKISRLGVKGSWPEQKAGEGVFNLLAPVRLKELEKPLKLEILPSITRGSNRQRIQPDKWDKSENFTEFGIGLKYGITSSITADITINPDFNQVESDAFQVEVNRRYPLFYSEKRPFFLEGVSIFSFFTVPRGFLPYAVYTRHIVDPLWGAKLAGTLGKVSFGILSASDEWPGQTWDSQNNPHEGKKAFWGIARGKCSLGKDNYIGVLYSGREFVDQYNRVIGADIGFRLSKNQKINASFLQSFSSDENSTSTTTSGNGSDAGNFNFFYAYSTKPLEINAAVEHIGKEFRMDSAYLKRTGFDEGWVLMAYNFYHDPEKVSWIKATTPLIRFQYLHDLYTDMDDMSLDLGLNFRFIQQGYLSIYYFARKESWMQQTFNLDQLEIYGGIQLTKWLQVDGDLTWGEKIYYEAQPAYKGKGSDVWLSLIIQPNKNLNQQFSIFHSDFSNDVEKVFDVNIYYSRTTYQFNKYFFLRGVIQYDSYQKRILTDLLASFTLIPGTVLHVGYGGLYENRKWHEGQWLYRQGDLINIKRSFFLKASYLCRF